MSGYICPRSMMGATNPANAGPGTIRGDFAVVPGRNVIHGSDSVDNGQREVGLWFSEEELVEWSPVSQPWISESS